MKRTRELILPGNVAEQPSREFIEWHNEKCMCLKKFEL
jgi:hypothetical protein